MKDLFDRHEDKLTESEDRRVWTAMRGALERKRPWWRRTWVPSLVAAGAVAALAIAVLGPDVLQRGGNDYLAGKAEEKAAVTTSGPATDLDETVGDDVASRLSAEAAPEAPGSPSGKLEAAEMVKKEPSSPANAVRGNQAAAEAYDEDTPTPPKPQARRELASAPAERWDYAQKQAAAGVIRGRVVDPKGQPLKFAFVTVTGADSTSLTDENGEFTLSGVPAGEHVLNVEYAGLDPYSLPVIVEDQPLLAEIAMTELNAQGLFALQNEVGDNKRDQGKTSGGAKETGERKKQDLDAGKDKTEDGRERLKAIPYVAGPEDASIARSKPKAEADALVQSLAKPGSPVVVAGGTESEANAPAAGAPVPPPPNGQAPMTPEEAQKQTRSGKLYFSTDAATSGAGNPVTAEPSGSRPPVSVGGTDPVNDEAYDAMFFRNYGVNPFVDAKEDNLATFAVDVDNGSYTLARSYLERGNLPPRDAIRVEEFINAIEHRYPAPGSEYTASRSPVPSEHGTFAIYLDAAPSPFGKDLTLLRVGLKGREIDAEHRKPANLTFVIDVSGSMDREDRLGLVKQSLNTLLDQMRRDDRVGIVIYGSNARMILPHTSLERRDRIEQAIANLAAEGATNAEDGLRQGYALADQAYRKDRINRVILCSDGVANVGNTGPESILAEIKREARRGIYMTAVGFGMGNYNDVLMEQLADQGDGQYFYVDDLREARRVFVENLTGTLQTIARDAKIQVEFAPDAVQRYRLLGYENRDVADVDFRNDKVDAGEVGAGHEVTALFEMKLDGKRRGPVATVRIRYEDPETGKVTEEARTLEYSDVAASFMAPDPTFRLDAAVAEFAEILRGSYWAKDGSLAQTAGLARSASRQMGNPEQAAEMIGLMDRAQSLWPTNEPTPWRDDPRYEKDDH